MKLKTLIDLCLTEGIADLIVIDYFNKTNLQQSVVNAKRLLSNKNKKDDFNEKTEGRISRKIKEQRKNI